MFSRFAPIALCGNDGFNVGICQFLADDICIVALVPQQCLDLVRDHAEQRTKALNIVAQLQRQDEAERSAFGIAAGVELCAESASRSAKRLGFLSPFLCRRHNDVPGPRCCRSCQRWRHGPPFPQRFEHRIENSGRHPTSVTPENAVPLAIVIRQVPPLRTRARNPHHAFEVEPIVLCWATATTTLSRQQCADNAMARRSG